MQQTIPAEPHATRLAPTPTRPFTAQHIPSSPPETPPPQAAPGAGSDPAGLLAEAHRLAAVFAERASRCDEAARFVQENYADLKHARFFAAGVPAALGGGGASYETVCELIRTLAYGCSSTSLAFSMHCHLVAALAWRWEHQRAPVDELLKRVARDQLVLVSSGGSDWLNGSGSAQPVEGGFRIHARKSFASGCLAGDLLMTSAVYDDPQAGPTILHFPIPLNSEHVRIVSTWNTLGMRGTGSDDVVIDGALVPSTAIGVRRPRGRWHPMMHLIAKIALPIIYATYVGVAQAARRLALQEAQARRHELLVQQVAGEMEAELFAAALAFERMVRLGAHAEPGRETTNEVLMARGLLTHSVIATVEKALELVGGRSFYRSLGLERLFRDVQAARFHPMPEKPQQELSGRLALGLELDPEPSSPPAG